MGCPDCKLTVAGAGGLPFRHRVRLSVHVRGHRQHAVGRLHHAGWVGSVAVQCQMRAAKVIADTRACRSDAPGAPASLSSGHGRGTSWPGRHRDCRVAPARPRGRGYPAGSGGAFTRPQAASFRRWLTQNATAVPRTRTAPDTSRYRQAKGCPLWSLAGTQGFLTSGLASMCGSCQLLGMSSRRMATATQRGP